jgi:hypothetical protein
MEMSHLSRVTHLRGAAEPVEDRAPELAEAEIRAAILMVALRPAYRVIVCGMAASAALLADLDGVAASAGVVLERRIRVGGGGLDVVVRAA